MGRSACARSGGGAARCPHHYESTPAGHRPGTVSKDRTPADDEASALCQSAETAVSQARYTPRPALGDGNAGTDIGIDTPLGSAIGYYTAHTASPDLELGPVQAPAFSVCAHGHERQLLLEWTTAYTRYPGDTQTARAVWVWDHCGG